LLGIAQEYEKLAQRAELASHIDWAPVASRPAWLIEVTRAATILTTP
jgi:hypothetical protein